MDEPLSSKVKRTAQIIETKDGTEISKTREAEETAVPSAKDVRGNIYSETTESIEPIKIKLTEIRKNINSNKESQTDNKRRKRESCAVSKKQWNEANKQTENATDAQTKEVKQEKVEIEGSIMESQEISEIYKCEICEENVSHSISLRGYSSKETLKLHIEREHKPNEKLSKSKKRSAGKQLLPTTKVEVDSLQQLSSSLPCAIEPMEETSLTQEENLTDLNEDQVHDEMTNHELENDEVSTVTFTINAVVSDSEENTKSMATSTTVCDTQPNETDNTISGQHQLLKVVKRFFCNVCHNTFDKRVRLIEHKRVHTGEKPFTCDECGKTFRIRIRLKEHKSRHAKEKNFICEICQLGCCTKQDLSQHMRHHTNDRRYQCTICPKAFVRNSDLKIHTRVHTGEKSYICDICNKCFRANQNLSLHKKSHLGDASKMYKCEHCEKRFMRNIDLKVHMRSHTGEKPYKCEICERGYSSKFNLRAHIERDHIATKGTDDTVHQGRRKPGPKTKELKEELEKQKKLIEELQNQLWHQLKRDEKIIPFDDEMLAERNLLDEAMATDNKESAYKSLN